MNICKTLQQFSTLTLVSVSKGSNVTWFNAKPVKIVLNGIYNRVGVSFPQNSPLLRSRLTQN